MLFSLMRRPEEDIVSCLNFFKETPQLLMGPADGYKPSVDRQGSGARRTLLWAALRLLSEQNRAKKDATSAFVHTFCSWMSQNFAYIQMLSERRAKCFMTFLNREIGK